MKKILLFILFASSAVSAQEQRYDSFAATLTSASGIGNLTQVIPNATITVFNQPAVGVSCAGGGCVAATTFTSRTGGTPCGGGLPLTRPTSTTCVATADTAANFGFWAAAGAYQYCVASTNITTQCFNVILGPPLDGVNTFSAANTFSANLTVSSTGTLIYANNDNSQSVTITPLAAAGSTATAVCMASATCTPDYGIVSLSPSGAGITTGDVFNYTFATAGDHIRMCIYWGFDNTANATVTAQVMDLGASTTSKNVMQVTTALTTAHVYSFIYMCH